MRRRHGTVAPALRNNGHKIISDIKLSAGQRSYAEYRLGEDDDYLGTDGEVSGNTVDEEEWAVLPVLVQAELDC